MWTSEILDTAQYVYQTTNSWKLTAEIVAEDFNLDHTGFVDFPGALRKAVQRNLMINQLPEPTKPQFEPVLEIPFDNALMVGDLHVDYYDRDFFAEALLRAEECNCSGIIIGGDFFNGAELSAHPKNEYVSPYADELRMAGQIIKVIGNLPWVKWIAFTLGNHDSRFTTKLNAYVSLKSLIYGALAGEQVTAQILTTDRDYAFYGNWGVGHLSSWNKDGGKLAYEQAKRHNKKIFAVWHDHIQGIFADHAHTGISVGSMLLEKSQFYKERRINKFAEFLNGYLINKNGRPLLFNKSGLHQMCGFYE